MARDDEVACAKGTDSFGLDAIAKVVQFDLSSLIRYSHEAGWSSLVARRAHNPKVVSSNLTPATMGAYEANPLSALLIYNCVSFVERP